MSRVLHRLGAEGEGYLPLLLMIFCAYKDLGRELVPFDLVFVYWHLILVTPDGPRLFLPRLTLAMVVCFVFDK